MRFLIACLFAVHTAVVLAERWQWDFESPLPEGSLRGDAKVLPIGPNAMDYVGMPETNHALSLDGKGDYVRIADEAGDGSLDFLQGDPITLEAWVRLDQISPGQNVYVVGKGRTHRDGPKHNQNYSLRLRSVGDHAALSFLFRSEATSQQAGEWHRWTSKSGIRLDGMWHHVAVTYQFGEPDSIRGYINGKSLSGAWDMGGPTERPPVVDDDDVWIGSSMGASPGSSLHGAIDQVVIAKRITTIEEYATRRVVIMHPPAPPVGGLVEDAVAVAIYENVGSNSVIPSHLPSPLVQYRQSAFGFSRVPIPYALDGVRRDWKGPSLLVAMAEIDLPAGDMQWMLRAGGLSKLWIGNDLVAETPKHLGHTNGHGEVEAYSESDPWLRPLHPGHREKIVQRSMAGGPTVVALQSMIGGKGYRYEAGEIVVAYRSDDSQEWQLLSLDHAVALTDEDWVRYEREHLAAIQQVDDRQRRATAAREDTVWQKRHQQARQYIGRLDPIEIPTDVVSDDPADVTSRELGGSQQVRSERAVDRLIDAGLRTSGAWGQRTPMTTDRQFLRRLYLDCVGVVPSPEEVRAFESLSPDPIVRRAKVIDVVLEDPRWADHWTAYWMDVLGENASMLKPSLNNSGPFRWFLYDQLRDNVAVDRWVTGLLRMEGSELFGGAAGFAMAADNDVPMAAKAHIATSAFLGVNMKCARCHDAPYHDWTQRDLFSLAAMLERKPLSIPTTSSVPAEFFDGEQAGQSLITLSVKAGDQIDPAWSLQRFTPDTEVDSLPKDARHRFAYQITRVENRQFAMTIVNRLWKQLMGQGIVEPVEDWEGADPSHPRLLDYLAREFASADFDFKYVARLILNSDAYQRQSIDQPIQPDETKRHFAAPRMRRMTAEQLVDSMHTAVGRAMDCNELTFDPEARMKPTAQNNLGKPRRAWQLTSLSNERDRPALSLPRAAAVAECMEAFGWTGSRQEPTNHRQVEPNVIQPGVLANGLLSIQLTVVTDGGHLVDDAITAESVEALVERLFERFLTRQPTGRERERFSAILRSGFEKRVLRTHLLPETPVREPNVSWANHLHSVATEVRMRQAERLRYGPMPSRMLEPVWRQQMEDVIWALINTPEFLFIP